MAIIRIPFSTARYARLGRALTALDALIKRWDRYAATAPDDVDCLRWEDNLRRAYAYRAWLRAEFRTEDYRADAEPRIYERLPYQAPGEGGCNSRSLDAMPFVRDVR